MHRALARYQNPTTDPESELIRKHRSLLDRCARMLASRTGAWSHFDDLWTVGALGLVEASHRFNPEHKVKFETFAEHRIKGAMLDELRRLDHLPRRLRARIDQVSKKRDALSKEIGRPAERDEVADALKITLSELDTIDALQAPPLSFEEKGFGVATLFEPDALISQRETIQQLAVCITTIPERLQLVLSLRYTEGLTHREIAQILDVSEPRVSQLHAEAVSKLKDLMTQLEESEEESLAT
jgi:RNA polymerase sigma factor FliA